MNKIIFNYLLKNFLKTFLIVVSIFFCFGMILNLFEEVEFFKNIEVSILMPLVLTSLYIPSLIIKILPFVIFISSMWFMIKIRNNKDLLTLKVFGYSNLKIFFVLATTSFIMGWLILIIANPITSKMSIFYEKTKSHYSRDIDHLVTFNKNGLWIKENLQTKQRIISADKPEGFNLLNVTIFHLDQNSNLIEKIITEKANIKNNIWILYNVTIFKPNNGMLEKSKFEKFEIKSIYNYEKINSLFKNFDTMSFLVLITNYKSLLNNGYNKNFLNQSLHSMLSLPFFLFLMTALASIFTMNTLKKSDSLKLISIGLITCVFTFYLKDLSIALGQTERIPLILSVWVPVIVLSLFTLIGVLQINEK
ncbi:LptF/LptG family permease [Pelagibacteraceae bacterium]|jgi:lipopolysaccharide export system permease protein|nr:LptF/LptG family permease [Pelagibacteraceae bacterium]MDC0952690.1 LptF/LptG family permease [Pelagibacteraceae bacterium]